MKKILIIGIAGLLSALTACSPKAGASTSFITPEPVISQAPDSDESKESSKDNLDADFKEIEMLLGMKNENAVDLFGGGKENWSEDKLYFIGYIYQIQLYGEEYSLYTTSDKEGVISSVSIWISNGDKTVTEEDANLWEQRITEFKNVDPKSYIVSSESGSKNWKWISNEKIVSLSWFEDLLTISMNPAIGELK